MHQPSIAPQLLLDLMYLDDVFIGERFMGLVVFRVLEKHLIHVRAGILVKLVAAAENNQGNLAVAQN